MKKTLDFDDQHIVIRGWMATKLGIKGDRVKAFALVYGFSQDGESEFRGTISYIEKWLSCSRPTAIKVMSDLEELGLVSKRQGTINGKTRNFYLAVLEKVHQLKNFTSKETLPVTSKETLPVTSKETLPNNIEDNIIDNNKGKSEDLLHDKFSRVEGLRKLIGAKHYSLLNEACSKGDKADDRYKLLKGMYKDGRFGSLMTWLEEKKKRRQTYKQPSSIGALIDEFSKYTPKEVELALRSSIQNEYQGIFLKRLHVEKSESMPSASGAFSGLKARRA